MKQASAEYSKRKENFRPASFPNLCVINFLNLFTNKIQ